MAQTSTQYFLEIEEVREGILVLKDRTTRGVMMVSSQNFALKSEEEQEATIYQFQNFLNSLDFSLQIIVQSARLNMTGYLEYLENLAQKQSSQLLRQQTVTYKEFIEKLIEGAPPVGRGGTIMAKNFFVIVPFSLIEAVSLRDRGISFYKPKIRGGLSGEEFQRMKNQLWQRMEFVALGLRRCGLHVIPLSSKELIELFWGLHHPQEAEVGYYPDIPPEAIK